MSTSLTRAELIARLDAGEVILLPTARAAGQLRRANEPGMSPALTTALSWAQWTQAVWSQLIVDGLETRLLLNSAQEHSVWQEIVAEASPGLMGAPDALAELAASAWQLAAQYQALGRLRATANTHDSRVFADWADTFMRRCAQRKLLAAAQLEEALRQHLEAGALTAPPTLTLAGFLQPTPAQQALLQALANHGTAIGSFSVQADAEGSVASTTLPAERDELEFAARWIRDRLEAHPDPAPEALIAVLVPDLGDVRAELEDTLRETLTPELQAVGSDLSSTPWEFSSGAPLSALPVLADALSLARWAAHALPVDSVTALLLSPYLGHNAAETERSASAQFDAAVLRRAPRLRDEIRLPWLLDLAAHSIQRTRAAKAPQDDETSTPSILATLRNLQAVLVRNDLQRARSWAEWTELLRDLNRAANWPGDRALNPSDFAATQAWERLLDTLATLDFAGRRIPYTMFLAELDRQASTTAFRPPSLRAPIQILPIAEAAGCTFDATLFLRATDANWPAAERIHPLLAWPLQRQLEMPGTDPNRAATRARAFTASLMQGARDILFTHAAEDADGKLRPSSLLAALPQVAAETLCPASTPPVPIVLETFADATALPALPASEVPGGSAVLKQQAACGFLAFAQFRLRAAEPKASGLGLDAGESGTVLHDVLQAFWERVETQQALRELPAAERSRILTECIDNAGPRRIRPETAWDAAYLSVQKERLFTVVDAWLEMELARSPFTVRAIETEQQITLGPLTLDLRLDRLDRVPGAPGEPDGWVLVDYKTGLSGHPRDWESTRPGDPQLPLYALLHEPDELKGLVFAKVRPGKDMKWHGLQTEAGVLPNPRANHLVELSYLLDEWRHTLTHLAEDFAAGDAGVRPRDFHVDCARCAQRLLCRVDFSALELPPAADTEMEEALDG